MFFVLGYNLGGVMIKWMGRGVSLDVWGRGIVGDKWGEGLVYCGRCN